jgi:hypothetical protein
MLDDDNDPTRRSTPFTSHPPSINLMPQFKRSLRDLKADIVMINFSSSMTASFQGHDIMLLLTPWLCLISFNPYLAPVHFACCFLLSPATVFFKISRWRGHQTKIHWTSRVIVKANRVLNQMEARKGRNQRRNHPLAFGVVN